MGRDRKRFNKKGRQDKKKHKKDEGVQSHQLNVTVDASAFSGTYDAANPLALPSKKKKKGDGPGPSVAQGGRERKLLTNKQRKKLQQIVDRREKKKGRAELLEELQKYQLPQDTFQKLTPLVQVQTEGLKKLFSQIEKDKAEEERRDRKRKRTDDSDDESGDDANVSTVQPDMADDAEETKVVQTRRPRSSIKGANTHKKQNQLKFRSWSGRFGVKGVEKEDPKILGFDERSSESEPDDELETESPQIKEEQEPIEYEDDQDDSPEIIEEVTKQDSSEMTGETNISSEDKTDAKSSKNTIQETDSHPVASSVPKTFVPVERTPEIMAVRSKLPIITEEQVIMESITESSVTVLAGETGSGKTTQVPQFLYEAGYALNGKLIGVTEPRRVAAIAMSMRVAKEMNVSTDVVSYQIRFEGNVSSQTRIKFMTDGVLLKEMERDFLLSKYSVICVDEAHERSLYTDLLIGLLSRCVNVRRKRKDPLKLVIMSATMRVEDFVENPILFKTPPRLIHVPTRQFPVQVHFSKFTPENYVLAAYKKTVQIHRKLPAGGILVFVTGQQEVRTLVNKLRKVFPSSSHADSDVEEPEAPKTVVRGRKKEKKPKISAPSTQLRTFNLDKLQAMPLQSHEEPGDDEDSDLDEDDDGAWDPGSGSREPLYVLPLFSMLPNKEQQRVFDPPPEGSRLCVIATNVAETSLTIPSVRYVVDCGKVKLKVWDQITGVQQFKISWESQASAEQRAGRAGRTGPGHCYRLFSSAVFSDEFLAYSKPEIQVRPVDDMILLMKSMAIDRVQNFPYPSPPGTEQLMAGEKTLLSLGALEPKQNERKKSSDDTTTITELGKTMAHFPLGPRFGKMLALSFHHSLVEYTIALVSALTVQEVFLDPNTHPASKEAKAAWSVLKRKWAGAGSSFLLGDCMILLRAVGAFEYDGGSPDFCLKTGLRFKAMTEIRKLRKQLTSEINLIVSDGEEVPLNPHMKPPTEEQSTRLRQIILSGLPDRVARKILESELKEGEDPKVYKHAYRCGELEDPVFLHTASVLRSAKPHWVVYQDVFESNGKMYLRGVTAIEPEWIPIFCKKLCKLENPLQDPPPFYDEDKAAIFCSVKATYGKQGWELPVTEVEYPTGLEKFKLFAQFFLEGQVFPVLAKWRPNLLSLPVTMTKPWAKLQPRTQILLTALSSAGIHRKSDLEQKWEQDERFLLKEYLQWLPADMHMEVEHSWPPLD